MNNLRLWSLYACRTVADSFQALKQSFRTDRFPVVMECSSQALRTHSSKLQQGGQPHHSLAAQGWTTCKPIPKGKDGPCSLCIDQQSISETEARTHTGELFWIVHSLEHCLYFSKYFLYFSAWYHYYYVSWLDEYFAVNLRSKSFLNVKYTKVFSIAISSRITSVSDPEEMNNKISYVTATLRTNSGVSTVINICL